MTTNEKNPKQLRRCFNEGHKPPRPIHNSGGPSKCKQEFKDQCDIKSIMQRYRETGRLPQTGNPTFGDFTQVLDFGEAKLQIAQAEAGFLELPSQIRARFKNDPQKLINFMENTENREEAIKLGLIEARMAPVPHTGASEPQTGEPAPSPVPEPNPEPPEPPKKGKGGEG